MINFETWCDMCLAILAYKVRKDYPLILLTNRDEFYARPSKPLHYWDENGSYIYAGQDEQAGGTWLGINGLGRWALVTNYREPKMYNKTALSRGKIVTDFLSRANIDGEGYINELVDNAFKYNPFNLLCGDLNDTYYYSSFKNIASKLKPGNIYALSNAELDTPWPKVIKARNMFRKLLEANSLNIDKYLEILEDVTIAPDNELPSTGVSLEIERLLSAIHIISPEYGTCSAGVIQVDKNQHVDFWEKTYPHLSVPAGMVKLSFNVI